MKYLYLSVVQQRYNTPDSSTLCTFCAAADSTDLIVKASNTSFINNTASQQGGAIHAEDWGLLQLQQCHFAGNTAAMSGGAISASGTPLEVTDTKFEGGRATFGAGLLLDSETATIAASTFWNHQVRL